MTPAVVLASMPWAPVTEPSLAVGILAAKLRREGVRTRALHLNVDLLKDVSFDTYVHVAEFWGIDEFVFTESLSPGLDDGQLDTLIERCAEHLEGVREGFRYTSLRDLCDMLLQFRFEVAPAYLERCADKVLAERPTLLGLTCMFDQTLASVALAKLVKERSAETLVVLGGYAVQGPPGEQVLKAFPWVDAIARGDGEDMIVNIARASVGEHPLNEIDGLLVRDGPLRPQRNTNLQASPDPDYRDWFEDVAALRAAAGLKIVTGTLPVESSRGCWWGQHKHCVFCGIDEETLKFRHKSSDRAFDMLAAMRSTYGNVEFRFSDYILPKPYFDELLPRLRDIEPRHRLKCEIKANQAVQRVRDLADAGFREVQPGIESFSSGVLKLMDKGVSGIQNVSLIKQGYLNEIVIHYNFLYGIPGETAGDYREMLKAIPRLYHLTPPVSRSEAIVTRFAPMHMDPARFGYDRQPIHHRCYDLLFSAEMLAATGFSLDDYAYYFERYHPFDPEMLELYQQCVAQINHWKRQHRERDVTLDYEEDGDGILFRDTRYAEPRTIRMGVLERAVCRAADEGPTRVARLCDAVSAELGLPHRRIEQAIERLDEERLVWMEDDRVLSLAVPRHVAEERLNAGWRNQWISIYR